MIVTENNVHDALEYMAIDPHPIALAKKDLTDAENHAKMIFARLMLASEEGSDKRREAEAIQHPNYLQAKEEESTAILSLERHKARMKAAEMLLEIWRSEQANVRAAEKIR